MRPKDIRVSVGTHRHRHVCRSVAAIMFLQGACFAFLVCTATLGTAESALYTPAGGRHLTDRAQMSNVKLTMDRLVDLWE